MSDAHTPPSGAAIDDTAVPKIAPGFKLQFEKAQDAWVLLYPEGMVKLNQSAGEIMQRCDGERDVAAVVATLEKAFEQEGLSDDVKAFLAIASQQNWIRLD
ncbi:MAG: pyrroloquinoline quinone biosynthesis peptide chaperone PqqD [Burkholderiaceae bacterium]